MLAVLLGVKWAKERELLGCVVDAVFIVVWGGGGLDGLVQRGVGYMGCMGGGWGGGILGRILKVHKDKNFFGYDFEFCTISLLVMFKY
jgi:hypothetical protein